LYSGARRNPNPSGGIQHAFEKINPLFRVCAKDLKINSAYAAGARNIQFLGTLASSVTKRFEFRGADADLLLLSQFL
jgi:hypothetical protein